MTTMKPAEGRLMTLFSHLQLSRRVKPHTEPASSSGRTFNDAEIGGSVSPGWEKVRTAFADNFAQRDELGASCCVTYKGEVVVDLCTRRAFCVPTVAIACHCMMPGEQLTQRRCVATVIQGVE